MTCAAGASALTACVSGPDEMAGIEAQAPTPQVDPFAGDEPVKPRGWAYGNEGAFAIAPQDMAGMAAREAVGAAALAAAGRVTTGCPGGLATLVDWDYVPEAQFDQRAVALTADARPWGLGRQLSRPAVVAELGGGDRDETVAIGGDPIAGEMLLTRRRVRISGCGSPTIQNLFGDALHAGLPGDTRASLSLQEDAVRILVAQAVGTFTVDMEIAAEERGETFTCDVDAGEPWVRDTAVLDVAADRRTWRERWELLVCEQVRTLVVRFEETPTTARFASEIDLVTRAE